MMLVAGSSVAAFSPRSLQHEFPRGRNESMDAFESSKCSSLTGYWDSYDDIQPGTFAQDHQSDTDIQIQRRTFPEDKREDIAPGLTMLSRLFYYYHSPVDILFMVVSTIVLSPVDHGPSRDNPTNIYTIIESVRNFSVLKQGASVFFRMLRRGDSMGSHHKSFQFTSKLLCLVFPFNT